MKNWLLITMIILCFGEAKAQSDESSNLYPRLIPPSPELASLENTIKLSATNYTGAAKADISLYNLKAGAIEVPITLMYATNGIKVNDIPGRVGLGWNLMAGGSINKIVHDEEDDKSTTIHLTAPPLGTHNQALLNFLFQANQETYDTEYDEYSYNVNGITGGFYFDAIGNTQYADKSAVKIERITGGFLLTTGEGIKYYFDENVETSYNVKLNGQTRGNTVSKSAYFLRMISAPDGSYIQFSYAPIHIRSFLGISQSALLQRIDPSLSHNYLQDCNYCFSSDLITTGGDNQVDYNSFYLTDISTSEGTSVNFKYENLPGEETGKRITFLTVNNLYSSTFIKKFKFEYNDYPIQADRQLRYYLSKLSTLSRDNAEELSHEISYYGPDLLPSQRSFAQDYFGYANGINNNQYFWPKPPAYESYHYGNMGANRNPNFNYSIGGALRRIKFPTGGYQEFEYEPHTMSTEHVDSSFLYKNLYTTGLSYTQPNIINSSFLLVANGQVKITLDTHQNPNGPLQQGPYVIGNGQSITSLKIIRQSNNELVYQLYHTENKIDNVYIDIPFNTAYLVELTVKGSAYRADLTVRYNTTIQSGMVNTNGCGIRVKQIKSYDPVSNKLNSKYYTYTSLNDLKNNNAAPPSNCATFTNFPVTIYPTSGIGRLSTNTAEFYPKGGVCVLPITIPSQHVDKCTNYIRAGSSSVDGGHYFNGSPVAYTNIIESDDKNFATGGIEHVYTSAYLNQNVLPILNFPPSSFLGFQDELDGKETQTTVFKDPASGFKTIKKEESFYSGDPNINNTIENYITNKRWTPPNASFGNVSMDDMLAGYDIGGYNLTAGWLHLDSKIVTTYDEEELHPVVERIDFRYGNTGHCLPTRIETTNSKGERVAEILNYPVDFYNTPVCVSMVDRNIITPVIQKSKVIVDINNNTNTVNVQQTEYKNWYHGNYPDFYEPFKIINSKANLNPEEKIQYKQYDIYGNPAELINGDGIKSVYLWNYTHSKPVAEIKNATLKTVAYSGFEAEDHGNWTYLQSGVHSSGITGKNCFTGNMKTNVNPNSYIVTIWAKAEVLVNSMQGTLINTKGSWHLYKWNLDNVSNVNVYGTDIDEVRLYPFDAHITTYTYYPEIGINSICDDNNNILYYEYDGFNRLIRIRDIDKNIIKQYEYVYHSTIDPCPSGPNWILTGNTRCVQSDVPGQNHNYTGAKEAEKKDINNCSPTYQQIMWIPIATPPGDCQAISCSGPDYRVINGICVQGERVLVGSDCTANSCTCSFRYRWCDGYQSQVFIETNTTSCPAPAVPE